VFLFRTMSFNGSEMGSVHSVNLKTVYIGEVADPAFNLHHEFVGILFEKFRARISDADFTARNPAGYVYLGSQAAFAQGKTSMKFDPMLYPRGFLCEFAEMSLMADFMSFGENLFLNKAIFWNAVAGSEPLRYKTDYVIAFYRGLRAEFTEDWFRALPAH
jgi:hypothetical protein